MMGIREQPGDRRQSTDALDQRLEQDASPARVRPAFRLRASPNLLTPLIGRELELLALDAMLANPLNRLVTITGGGGIGKTRLLLGWLQGRSAISLPAAWVPLASIQTPELVGSAIASSIGVHLRQPESWFAELAGVIEERELLLALDNMEHLRPAALWLGELLAACPNLRIVSTSRTRLALPGEVLFGVPPLPVPSSGMPAASQHESPAVRLLLDRVAAGESDSVHNDRQILAAGAIVRRLEGLPLAIELAADKASMLGLSATLDLLDESLLSTLGNRERSVEERHQTMREAIAWSAGSLSSAARAAFRRLSIFAGSFTLDAARFVAAGISGLSYADPASPTLDEILLLAEHHLIVRSVVNPSRFRMMQVIREFGLDQLMEHGETDIASELHASWFSEAARQLVFVPALTWEDSQLRGERTVPFAEEDLPNLRQAFSFLESTGQHEDLMLVPASLQYYAWTRGHLVEIWRLHERALTVIPPDTTDLRCRVTMWAGLLASVLNMEASAVRRSDESIAMAGQLNDAVLLGLNLKNRALIAARFDHDDEAIEWLHRAREQDPASPTIEMELALAHIRRRQLDLARQSMLRFHERIPDGKYNLINATSRLISGSLAIMEGNDEGARAEFSVALDVASEMADYSLIAETAMCTAAVALERRNYRSAGRLLGAAEALLESTSRPRFRNQPLFLRLRDETRAAFTIQAFAREQQAGAALPLDEVSALVRLTLASSDPMPVLTQREMEILRLIAAGMSDRDIADQLFISRSTASNHVAAIPRKLDARSRSAAVAVARERAILD